MDTVKDLNRTFVTMRNVTMISLLLLLAITASAGVLVYRAYEDARQRVYVISDGSSFSALSTSAQEHTQFEIRNLVKSFMRLMFVHDQYNYKANIDAALPLIDERSGRRIYEGFRRGQVYQNYVRYGARSTLYIDSLRIDFHRRPLTGRIYTRQRILVGDQQSQSIPLAAKFSLAETDRSEANPYGLLITNFDFIPYQPQVSKEEQEELRLQEEARKQKEAAAAEAAGVTPNVSK